MTKLADRTKLIKPSVTLAIAAKAGKLRAEGVDVVNFSAGEPDFDTPERIKDAAREALRTGMTKYTDVKGIEPLREAIAEKYRHEHDLVYRKEDVIVSCGAKHSLYNVLQAVVNPGDEVLIPAPYWVSYSDMALLAGGVPKLISSSEASGFRITPEQLRAALTPLTRVFLLNSPCNPTGATYNREELLAIAAILEKHDCLVLADDIYEKIIYDGFQVHNIVTLCPALRDRTIIVNGVSKTYAMTGWRIGYALGPGDVIVDKLNAVDGICCRKPEGAFYVFPNISKLFGRSSNGKKLNSPCDVADYFLEEAKVAGVPGEDFGSKEHIRFSYATSLEDIEKGCARIRQAVAKLC